MRVRVCLVGWLVGVGAPRIQPPPNGLSHTHRMALTLDPLKLNLELDS